MKQPKVSVIMTVYNRENYLEASIDSIIKQTYSDFELIIVDDGSSDQSLVIAKQKAKTDNRIKVYPSAHKGRAIALNYGHKQGKGEYLCWVDSDDLLAPTALNETVNLLETIPSVGMVYTNYINIDRTGRIIGEGTRCKMPYSPQQLLVDFMTFHFRLIRREAFTTSGGIDIDFNESAVDYDLCLRLSEITEVFHLKRPLYYYRNHSDSISYERQYQQIFNSQRAIKKALKRRKLNNQYEIEVKLNPQFLLRKKN